MIKEKVEVSLLNSDKLIEPLLINIYGIDILDINKNKRLKQIGIKE